MKRNMKSWLDTRLDRFKIAPETRAVAMVCFANVCYHYDYLCKHLSTSCPFRASQFFVNLPDEFLKCAEVKFSWSRSQFTPRITGIPPHVVLMAEMEDLKVVVNNLKFGIGKDIDDAFEKHMQCSSADYRTNCIVNAISASQRKMEDLIKHMGPSVPSVGPSSDERESEGGSIMNCIVEYG